MTADQPTNRSGDSSEVDPTLRDDALPSVGRKIGPYILRECIGTGGMGEVWRADQSEPVRRTVALKLIKAGMDSREVIARFEAERQALALMDHPCIARIFDAGTTPEGRPFFAMEYVQGIPINRYCDKRRLPTKQRLRLFQQVCEGVQHAHQKAVLHRDLKPNNVLVSDLDGKPSPKIIDFGVAKATTQKLTEKTMYTVRGQLLGTPEYMSPEQAELTGEDVDTRTDVYSLGVILYELLAGALPFDPNELRKAGFEGIRRIIRENEPQRPSTKVSTLGDHTAGVAKARHTAPSRLSGLLRGDLDWITMRALEKDRNRRYGSPHELAQDIQRHLDTMPVLAGPPSLIYKTRKYASRHRLGMGIAATALVVLVSFATMMVIQSQRIASERDRANLEADASRRVSEFLSAILSDVDPERMGSAIFEGMREQSRITWEQAGLSDTELDDSNANLNTAMESVNRADLARELLDTQILGRSLPKIEEDSGLTPMIKARLLQTIGTTYGDLGLYKEDEMVTLRALEIRQREFGDESPETLASMHELGMAYTKLARYEEAEGLLAKTLTARRRVLGEEHLDTVASLDAWDFLLHEHGERWEERERYIGQALEIRKAKLGERHLETLRNMGRMSDNYRHQQRYAEAESVATVVLSVAESIPGLTPKDRANFQWQLVEVFRNTGQWSRAEELARSSITILDDVLGREHPSALNKRRGLADILVRRGKVDAAMQMSREALETAVTSYGPSHVVALDSRSQHASLLQRAGRSEEAFALCGPLLADQRRVYGSAHVYVVNSLTKMGWILWLGLDRPDEASRYYANAIEILEDLYDLEHPYVISMKGYLAGCHRDAGRPELAESMLREVLELRLKVHGETHEQTRLTLVQLGGLNQNLGRPDQARADYAASVDISRRRAESPNATVIDLSRYASVLLEWEDFDFGLGIRDPAAAVAFAESANEKTQYSDPDHLDTLAYAYFESGRKAEAIDTQKKAVSLMTPDHPGWEEYSGRLRMFEEGLSGDASQ